MTSDNIYYDYQYSDKLNLYIAYDDNFFVIDKHLSFVEALQHILNVEQSRDIIKLTIIKFQENKNSKYQILEKFDLNTFDYQKYLALL